MPSKEIIGHGHLFSTLAICYKVCLPVALHALQIYKPSSRVGIAKLCCHNYTVGSHLSEHAGTKGGSHN